MNFTQDGIQTVSKTRNVIRVALKSGEFLFFDEASSIAEIKNLPIQRVEGIPIGTPCTANGGVVGNRNIFPFAVASLFFVLTTLLVVFYFIRPTAMDDSKRPRASTSQNINL